MDQGELLEEQSWTKKDDLVLEETEKTIGILTNIIHGHREKGKPSSLM